MRSETAKRILSQTPPEVREKVRIYADEVVRRKTEIEAVILTDEEKERAIYNAKIQKWNQENNAEYWKELEAKKVDSQRGKL